MKKLILFFALLIVFFACSQELEEVINPNNSNKDIEAPGEIERKLIVVTLDGLRWQEVFKGADSTLLFKSGTAVDKEFFWPSDEAKRKENVFDPGFFAKKGNLYGNRDLNNKVNIKNPTNLSYPGYHEIFTGNTTQIVNNNLIENPHQTVFEFINEQAKYDDDLDVQVYGISTFLQPLFRVEKSSLMIFSPVQIDYGQPNKSIDLSFLASEEFFNGTLDAELAFGVGTQNIWKNFEKLESKVLSYGTTILDNEKPEMLLYSIGKSFMQETNPKLAYFHFNMTDSYAHKGKYIDYLKAGHNVSVFLKDLIQFIETDSFYKNNTSVLITTDHGRGVGKKWKSHGPNIEHSDEAWFILINPEGGIKGVVEEDQQYYQAQLAATIAKLLKIRFEPNHEFAAPMDL